MDLHLTFIDHHARCTLAVAALCGTLAANASVTVPYTSPPINIANVNAYPFSGACDAAGGAVSLLVAYQYSSGTSVSASTPCSSGGTYALTMNLSALADTYIAYQATQTDGNGVGYTSSGTTTKDTVAPTCQDSTGVMPDVTPANPILNLRATCTDNSYGYTSTFISSGIFTATSLADPNGNSVPCSDAACSDGLATARINGIYTVTMTYRDSAGNPGAGPITTTFVRRFLRNRHQIDFNGDGLGDLPWYTAAGGSVGIWLTNMPNPPIAANGVAGPATGRVVQYVDFNGDGKTDLLWRTSTGEYWIGLMDGLTQTSLTKVLDAGSGWEVQHAADLNNDTKADLIWKHPTYGYGVWLMDGATITSAGALGGAGGQIAAITDLDGDGNEDIVWTRADGSIATVLMDGFSVRSSVVVLPAGSGWSPVLSADFDGDGRGDLVFRHANGTYMVWIMNGNGPTATGALRSNATTWNRLITRKLNGDATDDLVWQNDNGAVEGWLMNGTGFTSYPLLSAGTGWWVIGGDRYNAGPFFYAPFSAPTGEGLLWRNSQTGAYGAWLLHPPYTPIHSTTQQPLGAYWSGQILDGGTGWESAFY